MAGPITFATPMLRGGLWLEGEFFHEGSGYYPGTTELEREGRGARLLASDSTHVVQHLWTGGDAPVNLAPMSGQVDFLLTRESDYWRFDEAKERGDVRRLWMDHWITDQWYLPAAASGQVLFRTSRRLPYNGLIAGVTVTGDRKPQAFLETAARVQTAQTVVQTAPGAGEVKVPDSDDFADVEIPSGITDPWLLVRYPAVLLVRVVDLSVTWQDSNAMRVSVSIEEALGGSYTPA